MQRYSFQKYDKEKMCRAKAFFMPVSAKHSREIAKFIVRKNALKVMNELEQVQKLKLVVPFTRFKKDMGHKRGIAAGRYPVKASKYIAELLKNALANAKQKGFAEQDMVITHVNASLSLPKERRRGKFTTFEIVLENAPAKKEKKQEKVEKK